MIAALVAIVLLASLGRGWRYGLLRSLASMIGLIAGATAAFFAIPLVAAWVPDPFWRPILVIAAVVALILLGSTAGNAVGRALQPRRTRSPLRRLDQLGGAIINLVVGALVTGLIAGSVASLGIPV